MSKIDSQLAAAIEARSSFFDEKHRAAFRLFNGFLEGNPALIVDLYARTLLVHNYAKQPESAREIVDAAVAYFRTRFDWLDSVVVKQRFSDSAELRNGIVVLGQKPARSVEEYGVRYAVDLQMNRDASFYLDTRNLRHWLLNNASGLSVLNTFAYTGSLGVAAFAAGASRVLQTDLNKQFLNLAKTSHSLNGFPIHKPNFQAVDFWSYMNRLKRAQERFDVAIIDPPFFSDTKDGKVDLAHNTARLINKVRPIVRNGGRIVVVNNALFVSGAAFLAALDKLCIDGWVTLEEQIPISADFVPSGIAPTAFPTDPTPFNHTTKIAVLRIKHKVNS